MSIIKTIQEKLLLSIDADNSRLVRFRQDDEILDAILQEMLSSNILITQEKIRLVLARENAPTSSNMSSTKTFMSSDVSHAKEISLI